MIIGLTGTLASGKGVVSDYLKQKNFSYYSLSNEVRKEAKKRKIKLTRKNLQDLGNKLREREGISVLAKRVIKQIKEKNVVIDGIRNPAEIHELRKLPNFLLIAVDAPLKTRANRLIQRGRSSDPKNFEGFLEIDDRDKGFCEKNSGQQVIQCIRNADFLIVNDNSITQIKTKVDKLIKEFIQHKRPNWDDYFLKLALVVAERSTCLRHHVGAVAVKNKRILATGYNGALSGLDDCLKLGCLRNKLKIPSGEKHEVCRAVHAEQNLIVQAALHGTNLEGATIYCTHSPCILCAKLLANTKIKRYVTFSDYPDKNSINLFKKMGIEFKKYKIPSTKISMKL